MAAAYLRYTSAMRLINRALQDPVVAAQDQTLISVLLLGLYEANTCTTINAITSALKHIGGAMAILEFRGGRQLETVIGFRLFTQLRTQITSLCTLQRRAIPESILSLSALCGVDGKSREDHICSLSDIVAKFCSFRADLSSSAGEDINPDEKIARARMIDAELASWHAKLPHDILPTAVQLGGPRSEKSTRTTTICTAISRQPTSSTTTVPCAFSSTRKSPAKPPTQAKPSLAPMTQKRPANTTTQKPSCKIHRRDLRQLTLLHGPPSSSASPPPPGIFYYGRCRQLSSNSND